MIRTLHWYISRDLAKVTCLALVSLTLLMTVFGIMEPMRKWGLGSDQVLALFGYLVPVMLSLTLPVAALFAGTIVYGRFSQDNELMACRASGVSTVSLLKPALLLGALVTCVALVLNNFVAPTMMERAERAVKDNVAGIVFPQLRTSNYVKQGTWLVHADEVDSDAQTLRGVVVLDAEKPEDMLLVMAARARIEFVWYEGRPYAIIDCYEPFATRTGNPSALEKEYVPTQFPLPSPAREKAAWYSWGKLVATLRNPAENQEIDRELTKIKRRISRDMFAQNLAEVIRSGKPYDKIRRKDQVFVIRSTDVDVDGLVVKLGGEGALPGGDKAVGVEIMRGDEVEQTITAESGEATARWSDRLNRSFVTIVLHNALVRGSGPDERHTRLEWLRGELEFPANLQTRTDTISMQEICSNPTRLTANPSILHAIKRLWDGEIRKLLGKVKAEMHVRIAYGASCFLLVAMGSALGLIFKGGHFVSAFAIALVPGAVVIVMMIMGKEIVRNPDVSELLGLACIWGGIVALAVANALVYLQLTRR